MTAFTESELRYLLQERLLARIATVGVDGTPHIAPVGWSFNREHGAIDVGSQRLERTKKYRDVERTGRAALVIDDVLPPWRPRGIEIRGRAESRHRPCTPHSHPPGAHRFLGPGERGHGQSPRSHGRGSAQVRGDRRTGGAS